MCATTSATDIVGATPAQTRGGESPAAAAPLLRGASDRFGGTHPAVLFGVPRQQSAKLRRTTAEDVRSYSVAGVQHPPQPPIKKSLMLQEAAVKTALKKRPQTRGLRSNGGNP